MLHASNYHAAQTKGIVALYEQRASEHECQHAAMLMTREYQKGAFELATSLLGDLSELKSIVDVGCGYGHFLGHLRSRGFAGTYTGIDVVPSFVAAAQKQYCRDEKAFFMVLDFLDDEQTYFLNGDDAFVAASVFGIVTEEGFMQKVINKAALMAEKKVVLTCTSSEHQVFNFSAKTYHPSELLSFGLRFSSDVQLAHSAVPAANGHYSLIGMSVSKRSSQTVAS